MNTSMHFGIEFSYPTTVICDFSQSQWKWSREPVMRRMPDDSILCIHYTGGPWEPDDQNLTVFTKSTDDGKTWTVPEILFDHPHRAIVSTEIFVAANRVYVGVMTFNTNRWYVEQKAYISYSDDSGKTWSEPITLPGNVNSFSLRRGFVMSNGKWFFPLQCQEINTGFYASFTREKCVEDKNWILCSSSMQCEQSFKQIENGRYFKRQDNGHLWEPNAIEAGPGHIIMFMRASGTGVLYRANSFDYGKNWTDAVPTDIPNADTKITLLKIEDTVVLLNNPTNSGRTKVELWASNDGCETWNTKIKLAEIQDGTQCGKIDYNSTMVCYPDGFADEKQNLLYVTFEDGMRHYLMKIPFNNFL